MTAIRDGYYRVTEIIEVYSKMHLINPNVLENAKVRGNEVDLACKMLINGIDPLHLDEEYQGYLDSFKAWSEGKEFIPNPGRFYCDKLMLTGECDAIYKSDTGLVLIDIKTPAAESKSWPLQGAAYCYLAREIGLDIKSIEFVRLIKEGKPAKVYTYEYEKNWELFKKALELYQYFFKPKKANLED